MKITTLEFNSTNRKKGPREDKRIRNKLNYTLENPMKTLKWKPYHIPRGLVADQGRPVHAAWVSEFL